MYTHIYIYIHTCIHIFILMCIKVHIHIYDSTVSRWGGTCTPATRARNSFTSYSARENNYFAKM